MLHLGPMDCRCLIECRIQTVRTADIITRKSRINGPPLYVYNVCAIVGYKRTVEKHWSTPYQSTHFLFNLSPTEMLIQLPILRHGSSDILRIKTGIHMVLAYNK